MERRQKSAGGKHAVRGALAGDAAPPGRGEAIVRALGVSANQVEIQRPDGTTGFVLLPARFHKRLWIKRGGFLVVTTPEPPAGGGAGLAGEVVSVLYTRDVARMRRLEGVWPVEFREEGGCEEEEEAGGESVPTDSDDSGLPPLAANPNRRRPTYASSSSSEEAE